MAHPFCEGIVRIKIFICTATHAVLSKDAHKKLKKRNLKKYFCGYDSDSERKNSAEYENNFNCASSCRGHSRDPHGKTFNPYYKSMTSVYIGSDHAGLELKQKLKEHLQAKTYHVVDLGVFKTEPRLIIRISHTKLRKKCAKMPGAKEF